MKKQSVVDIFLSSDRSEWFDLCTKLATGITETAVEFSEYAVNNDELSSSILDSTNENELEYEALFDALKEFYYACVIVLPVMGSYMNPIKDGYSILDIVSLQLLKDFAELYDYEFKDDLMTLFLGIYDIFAPTDNSMLIPQRLNRILIEFYNNNAEEDISDDSIIVTIFDALPMAKFVSDVMLTWPDLSDLAKIEIEPDQYL